MSGKSSFPLPKWMQRPDWYETICGLCEEVFSRRPNKVVRLSSSNNEVYRLEVKKHPFVLKIAGEGLDGSLEYEAVVASMLYRHGIPFPEIVAQGKRNGSLSRAWLLMEHGGAGIDSYPFEEQQPMIVKAGEILAHIHHVKYARQGFFTNEGRVFAASKNELLRVDAAAAKLKALADANIIERQHVSKAEALIDDFEPSDESVLCHGEYTYPHMLVDGGQTRYIVDWPSARAFTRTSDLAVTEVISTVLKYDFESLRRGYTRVCSLDEYDEEKTVYLLVQMILRLPLQTTDEGKQRRFHRALIKLLDEN